MKGDTRRKQLLEVLEHAASPVSGTELAKALGISRQVVVQDIALLRADNRSILSTNKGYIIHQPELVKKCCRRVFRTNHSNEDMMKEFYAVVDYGGSIVDVSIEHELYGQIKADLIIENRLDAMEFMNQMEKSRDLPLKALTGGCHYHTVEADTEKHLDFIEEELKKLGFLY